MSPSIQTARLLVRLEETGAVGVAAAKRNDIGNLPLELTSFVGREQELAEAKARLAGSRLVTLTGVGGVGKTRLAMRVADEMRTEFEDGAWLVELDQLVDPALLANAIAATLGLREQSSRPLVDVLVGYLAERRLLLLLDNCEHLLDPSAALAERLLRSCPDLRILATSREPLGIRGEAVVSVPPLAVPEGDARLYGEVSGFDAVTLFIERAKAVVPEFRLREDNQAAVGDICHRLDGLPLAIELAAARLRTLPVDEIARRLNDRYQLLSTRMRGIPSRHQTLWASLEWSYDLCSADERRLWARLSVFRGGFELDAAEAVCAGEDLPAEAILDLVAALVDKSIVLRERAGSRARYRLLETIRDFGWATLREAGEALALRRRHRDWYDQFLKQVDADWIGPRQVDWLNQIDRDSANLRAAVDFCLSEPGEAEVGLRMATALAHCYGFGRGKFGAARHRLDQVLTRDTERTPDRLRALYVASILALFQGDTAAASDLVEQSRTLANRLGTASARADAAKCAGSLAVWSGDARRATACFEECLSVFREEGDVRSQVEVLIGLGQSVRNEDPRRAVGCFEEVLAITEPHGELVYRSYSLWALGIAVRESDPQRALSLLTQGLVLKREIDEPMGAAWCLEGLAWLAASMREHGRAATLLGAAQALADAMGARTVTPPYLDDDRKDCERQARGALGEAAFESAFEHGIGMSADDAVGYVLKQTPEMQHLPPPARQRVGTGGLTAVATAGEQQKPTVRVLIVDSNRVEADGVQLVLDQHPDLHVVGIATNVGDAVPLASATRPDVILADYRLPDSTGAELAARLRKDQPALPVLLLSAVVSSALLQEAVKAGARGFLLKSQPAEELADAVRRAAAGEMLISAARLAALIAGSDKSAQLFDLLTGREREVLRLLAAGLDNRHIAARMGIGYVTVRSHLRNLSSKLDAHSKVEILARSAELGLIVR
jgi:predicted ATPase/DNA-binding NarL/FixJ family response regulator